MKKLMIAAAIVCAAAFAQAASCTWNTYAMDTSYGGLDNGTFWLVSLGTDSGVADGFKVYSDGTYDFGGYTVADTGTIPAGTYGSVSGKITGLDESNNGDYYALVVWDGKAEGFYASAEAGISGIVNDPPADANLISFDNSGFGGTMIASTAVEAVPEPTSGLLLLLGVAGLALRRRRA